MTAHAEKAADRQHGRGILSIRAHEEIVDLPNGFIGVVGHAGTDRVPAVRRGAPPVPEAGDVTLIAVGGGAFLVPDRLAGISEVVRGY
jgi:hypothetical protein